MVKVGLLYTSPTSSGRSPEACPYPASMPCLGEYSHPLRYNNQDAGPGIILPDPTHATRVFQARLGVSGPLSVAPSLSVNYVSRSGYSWNLSKDSRA